MEFMRKLEIQFSGKPALSQNVFRRSKSLLSDLLLFHEIFTLLFFGSKYRFRLATYFLFTGVNDIMQQSHIFGTRGLGVGNPCQT